MSPAGPVGPGWPVQHRQITCVSVVIIMIMAVIIIIIMILESSFNDTGWHAVASYMTGLHEEDEQLNFNGQNAG